MWKHRNCGGEVHAINNGGGDWCSKCNQEELYDSDIYCDHYILNEDGTLLSQEVSYV